ncbi:MAG: hypothetical protein JNL90_10215 [Planctomycetes bacterium]|nr:hypothetical protein [Planctomycetota bacterium]
MLTRFMRFIGFTLSLLAATISSLASGATIIRCEEPDGCVEIELVSNATPKAAVCGDHEHETPSTSGAESVTHGSCPCVDTVIASLADAVLRGGNDRALLTDHAAILGLHSAPLLVVAERRPDHRPLTAARPVDHRQRYSQRSVVLRI